MIQANQTRTLALKGHDRRARRLNPRRNARPARCRTSPGAAATPPGTSSYGDDLLGCPRGRALAVSPPQGERDALVHRVLPYAVQALWADSPAPSQFASTPPERSRWPPNPEAGDSDRPDAPSPGGQSKPCLKALESPPFDRNGGRNAKAHEEQRRKADRDALSPHSAFRIPSCSSCPSWSMPPNR